MKLLELKRYLDAKAALYDHPDFIAGDPVCIPHRFSKLQDIEIAGLFAATLAWGNRTTIISKCRELLALMDNAPYDYIRHHKPRERMQLLQFCHRTFNGIDLMYFTEFLQHYYTNVTSSNMPSAGTSPRTTKPWKKG